MKKPTVSELGIDPDALDWQRSASGEGAVEGAVEVAFVGQWTLLRTSGDLISVFDEHEWACFLDGVKKGEFDRAAS
ncbi:DUF397 domain-containing protein [Actinomadura formosensis]|uniref:DUF397 domain-containing protein n=1 Tax=Actinomadura formosensis TaxID=60706 RepID=UPI00082CD811|nr:DUF397 domain-containing protein [Actinomadura formosensis]